MTVFTLPSIAFLVLSLAAAQASPYEEEYGTGSEHEQTPPPVLRRHIRRIHMPIVYKHRPHHQPPISSYYPKSMSHSMGDQYEESSHGINIDMDWRGWMPMQSMPPQHKSSAVSNSESSSYESEHHPPRSVSRMYFKKYRAPSYNEMPDEEPIEIGGGPPPPSMSPSVADLYSDLQERRRHRRYRAPHPIVLDFREYQQQSYESPSPYSPAEQGGDHMSMYPNFDDDHNLYGQNNYFRRK